MTTELETLAAIYPELEYSVDTLSGSLQINATFDKPIQVIFSNTNGATSDDTLGESRPDTHAVSNLPPLTLYFTLPPDYPESAAPEVDVHCLWLSESHKSKLLDTLNEEWLALKDDSLFVYIDLIRDQIERVFSQSIPLELPTSLLSQILAFDASADQEHFSQLSFPCSICQVTKKGTHCTQLDVCSHVCCTPCLKEYYGSCITQGYIEMVHCVDPECKEPLSQDQLLVLVGSTSFERYKSLVHKKKLEKDPNSVICPRTNCDTLVFRKKGDYMARCSKCRYAFCVNCRKAWHGSYRGCVMDVPPDEVLLHYMDEATDEEKLDLDHKWGKANLEIHVKRILATEEDERLFRKAMQEAKIWPCPRCEVPIEKADGCNKITCPLCNVFFCHLCGSIVPDKDPYSHYREEGTPCFGKMWEGITEEELERRAHLAMMGEFEEE